MYKHSRHQAIAKEALPYIRKEIVIPGVHIDTIEQAAYKSPHQTALGDH
jgi:hypothetical protein